MLRCEFWMTDICFNIAFLEVFLLEHRIALVVKRRCDGMARGQLASAWSRRKAVLRRVVGSCLVTIQTVLFGIRRPGDLVTLTVTRHHRSRALQEQNHTAMTAKCVIR